MLRTRRPQILSGLVVGCALALGASLTVLTSAGASPSKPPATVEPAIVAAPVVSTPAAASPLQVTLVARYCPQYTDITANRARNNIQESLRDLGVDTLYNDGEAISVAKENAGQPNCQPIPGWTFQFGSGIAGGNPSNISVITGSNPNVVKTAATVASTPELDKFGNTTGRDIAGAVTVNLTPEQAALGTLWLQGGTNASRPTSQLNGQQVQYGFGALRCSIDNLNGDNVEQIRYPQGTTHAYCFAYYVTPPPSSATIVVRKQTVDISGNPIVVPQSLSFPFQGNVSYNSQPYQGAFNVTVNSGQSLGSITFIRGATDVSAGGTAWTFNERDPVDLGWVLYDVSCSSSSSTATVDIPTGTVTISKLVAGDTVTCTYKDRPVSSGKLELAKVTRNGFGGPFDFAITTPTSSVVNVQGTTLDADVPELVAEQPAGGPLGTYSVVETLPGPTGAGSWAMTAVNCIGPVAPVVDLANRSFSITITADGQSDYCLVENTFTPTASITIRKITSNGTATTDFDILSIDPSSGAPGEFWSQSAETTSSNVAATATGDVTTGLDLGRYQIYETMNSTSATPAGLWELTSVDCGPIIDGAGTEVTLSAANPNITCTFTNTLTPYGTLRIAKAVTGDLAQRVDRVVIETRCFDGQSFTLTAPAGESGPWSLDSSNTFDGPTPCIAVETYNGVAAGASVTTTWTIDNGSTVRSGSGPVVPFLADLGEGIIVAFTNTYSVLPPAPDPGVAPTFTA